jgi:predicted dehydrogenase
VAVALSDADAPTYHEERYSPLATEDNPYRAELAHFLHCLETGATPRVTPHDALMAVKVSLAAIESVRTGQPIEIATFKEARA